MTGAPATLTLQTRVKPLCILAALVALGAWIWQHSISGTQSLDEALPLAAAFPLYLWLTMPWEWLPKPGFRQPLILIAGPGLFLAGIVGEISMLTSLGWVVFLEVFQSTFLKKVPVRYLILPLLGFPWVTQNLEAMGWLFRYTGAGAVETIFNLIGMHVHREGTLLFIRDISLSVEPACAGLNILQSLLVVGTWLICLRVPAGWRFWTALGLLIPLAWIANTARIFMLGCAGLTFGADFATGWFHKWGGWVVLCLMFLMCQVIFGLLAGKREESA